MMQAVAVPSLESCVRAAVERRIAEAERAHAARVAHWHADRAGALDVQRQELEAVFTPEQRDILQYQLTGALMPPTAQGCVDDVWAAFSYGGEQIRMRAGNWRGGRLQVTVTGHDSWEFVSGSDVWEGLLLTLDYLVPQEDAR